MSSRSKVQIYDTTLRDGAQGEGITFSNAAKLKLALRLDAFGVDYIEGGYAGSNEKDMQFFRDIRRHSLRHARIAAFGNTRRANTTASDDPQLAQLLDAAAPVATIFGKTWRLHVRDVLRTTEAENRAMIADTVRHLKAHDKEVIFDAEHFFDGYKDSPAFALKMLHAAAEAGATTVVLCDTNGGSLPQEIFEITGAIRHALPAEITLGIHTHNDADMAVANTLEAIRAGATHVQGTINGYGERTGNANLCSIIPSLALKMGIETVPRAHLAQVRDLARFTDDLVGLRYNTRAPYVGDSAFSHKGGMHVNAVQKNPRTFEHVPPETVGNVRRILIAETSGTSSVLLKAIEMGVKLQKGDPEVRELLDALKELEHKGYTFEAADASFRMLIQKVLKRHKSFFELEGFRVTVEKQGSDTRSEAAITVRVGKDVEHTVADGDGPVNALDRALRKALTRFYPEIAKVALTDFSVRILDPEEATAAKTRVIIESSDGQATWGTVGVSGNIIEASWEALVDSVEYKLFRDEEQRAAGKKSGE
ncbi:MAG: citramalate synthase [bacterium]